MLSLDSRTASIKKSMRDSNIYAPREATLFFGFVAHRQRHAERISRIPSPYEACVKHPKVTSFVRFKAAVNNQTETIEITMKFCIRGKVYVHMVTPKPKKPKLFYNVLAFGKGYSPNPIFS